MAFIGIQSHGLDYACILYADEVVYSKTKHCKLNIWYFQGRDGVEMYVNTIFCDWDLQKDFCTGSGVRMGF